MTPVTDMTKETIVMKIVESYKIFDDELGRPTEVSKPLTCSICSASFQPGHMMCHGCDSERMKNLFVCPDCLRSQNLDQQLSGFAQLAEGRAAYLRSLIGRLKLPDFEELVVRDAEAAPEVVQLADKYLVPVRTAAAIYMEGRKQRTMNDEIPF